MIDLPDLFIAGQDNDMYEHYNEVKRFVEVKFVWSEYDEYMSCDIAPHDIDGIAMVWYLGSLVDMFAGGRVSRLEHLPVTWFISPRSNEFRFESCWYHE